MNPVRLPLFAAIALILFGFGMPCALASDQQAVRSITYHAYGCSDEGADIYVDVDGANIQRWRLSLGTSSETISYELSFQPPNQHRLDVSHQWRDGSILSYEVNVIITPTAIRPQGGSLRGFEHPVSLDLRGAQFFYEKTVRALRENAPDGAIIGCEAGEH